VPVGADSEQDEVELGAAQLLVVVGGGLLGVTLAADAVDVGRHGEAVEQGLAHEVVVGARVRGRHAALVGEPEVDAAPARFQPRGQAVRGPRGRAAGERQ
jgi:hypothetical protein